LEKNKIIVTSLGSVAACSIFLVIVMLVLKDQASYAVPFWRKFDTVGPNPPCSTFHSVLL